ncbi:Bax inhibitor-1 family protein [Fimbriimonas ginsengisoli]|uniref:Uncharacterized protein n=1 Tax=Fimbriimonas ginsengisoli Gsoil 348 TaxID=661478 RepID=A0A068NL55_FIMGI|nr:Bax inhibitor-1 family protein [Fimbriimonas ginsengisoli]AIE84142.1 hypothetical protein OP10G_0774 [Fimbriimonas ginsengisoli Gsoil 348]
MIVPNYVPDPLEVPGNVTLEPQPVRIVFIRRVTLLHLFSLGLVTGLATAPWPRIGLTPLLVCLAMVLVGLDMWRILQRGRPTEASVSGWLLPAPVAMTAWLAHELALSGWPVAAPLAGAICATIYTVLCGRDFSFVGCTLLALIVSSVALAGLVVHFNLGAREAAVALVGNAAYLVYLQYDLASLLARRRRGEELAAVVDLYRDVFNVFGYVLRVWKHWRKHRIWDIVR